MFGMECFTAKVIIPSVIFTHFQSILLSDESSEADSQSEDNDDEEEELNLSREELHNMLRLHKYKKLHQNKYSKDKEVSWKRKLSPSLL
jgi:DNA helicase INO80